MWLFVAGTLDEKSATAWRDPRIVQWIEKNARGVQVDVRAVPVAERPLRFYGNRVFAFFGGVEVARLTSVRPRLFLDWAERLLAAAPFDLEVDRCRISDLVDRGEFEAATAALCGIWSGRVHALWRWTYRQLFATLVELHPPAVEAFRAIRDANAPALGNVDPEVLSDWVQLNEWLGDPEVTLRWFDALERSTIGAVCWELWTERKVVQLLASRGRWADAGAALATESEWLEMKCKSVVSFRQLAETRPEAAAHIPARLDELRSTAALIVRALRSASRIGTAVEIYDRACESDPSPEMRAALEQAVASSTN